MDRRQIGNTAENAARDYLLARGLKIVGQNFRCKAGELDLIALEGQTLAIVEVRLRSSARYGGAAASVGWHKQTKLLRATQYLLLTRPDLRGFSVRFDVITLDGDANIQWLRGAFGM